MKSDFEMSLSTVSSAIIISHYQSRSIIISNYQSSSVIIIINHHQSRSIIISNYQSSSVIIIINHHQSRSIIISNYQSSSVIIIINHLQSSSIIISSSVATIDHPYQSLQSLSITTVTIAMIIINNMTYTFCFTSISYCNYLICNLFPYF